MYNKVHHILGGLLDPNFYSFRLVFGLNEVQSTFNAQSSELKITQAT